MSFWCLVPLLINICIIWREEKNLVLNWEKCHFMVKEGIILGHRELSKDIEVDPAKISTIEKLPFPQM